MKKVFLKAIMMAALFFMTWFLLSQINWTKVLNTEKVSADTEEKLGDLFWEIFQKTEKENTDYFVEGTIDSLVTQICVKNDINRESIKVRIIQKDEVNAFAMPGGYLVIYTGLISKTDNQSELCGVICHEIAHLQLNHVMKKLIKEFGLSVLISITTGNSSPEIMIQAIRLLSSSAFDRSLEREADIMASDYMMKAGMNPEALANFLFKLSLNEGSSVEEFSWLSTHPDSKERANYIIQYSKDKKYIRVPAISDSTFLILQQTVK